MKLISGNQDFKIMIYSISLLDYKNDKKQPNYMEWKANEFVVPNISPGTYHLYLKTEYTPSDDDVAYFVSTVKVQNKVSNSGEQTGYTGSGGEKTNAVKASGQFKKEQILKYRTEINATIQITTFNETRPSDVIFKLTHLSDYSAQIPPFHPLPSCDLLFYSICNLHLCNLESYHGCILCMYIHCQKIQYSYRNPIVINEYEVTTYVY